MTKVSVCLDPERFSNRPVDVDPRAGKRISFRVARYRRELEIPELAAAVVAGQSWTPATFTGIKRANAAFASQQVFAVDIDKRLTIDEALQRCFVAGIAPAFIYTSFRHTPEAHRFRIVFVLPGVVYEHRIRKAIQILFMEVFPDCDPSCKDAARLFFGGRTLVHQDYDARVDIMTLVQAVSMVRYEQPDRKNLNRSMAAFCRKLGVDMLNHLPDITTVQPGQYEPHPSLQGHWKHVSDPAITVTEIGGKAIGFRFSSSATLERSYSNKMYEKSLNRVAEGENKTRNVNWDELLVTSDLFRRFSEGLERFAEPVLFGIATNMMLMVGGRKRFLDALERHGGYDLTKWEGKLAYIQNANYIPANYSSFYPEAKEQEGSENLINTAVHPSGEVVQTQPYVTISRDEAQKRLKTYYDEALGADDSKVYLIIAPAGLGKTEIYTNGRTVAEVEDGILGPMQIQISTKPLLIAVPTHQLKWEVAERATRGGHWVMWSPKPQNLSISAADHVDGLYAQGKVGQVSAYLHRIRGTDDGADTYLDDLAGFYNHTDTAITTHARLLWMNPDRDSRDVVIDEDILPNLLQKVQVSGEDLCRANDCVQRSIGVSAADKLSMQSIYQQAMTADDVSACSLPIPSFECFEAIQTALTDPKAGISKASDVLQFLQLNGYTKSGSILNAPYFHQLSEKRKYIIFSATASETLYRKIFGDRLVVMRVGDVETVGSIEQYTERSYSRTSLRDTAGAAEIACSLTPGKALISFKGFGSHFQGSTIDAHFHGLSGIDSLKGRDTLVVGTPHLPESVYVQWAIALGEQVTPENLSNFYRRMVERNGYRFRFKTFELGSILHEVQMYLIESELNQAVGRARIIWENCTVMVLSNFPVKGAKLKSKSEWNEMLATIGLNRVESTTECEEIMTSTINTVV